MEPAGWIPAHRKIFDPEHDLWQDETICPPMAWLDLCQMAATDRTTRKVGRTPIRLQRAELLASLRYLAGRWNWSVKKVRNFLEYLERSEIKRLETVRGTQVGTVYRIVNYDTYALSGHSKPRKKGTGGAQVGHDLGTKTRSNKNSSSRAHAREGESAVENSPLAEWGVPAVAVEALRALPGYRPLVEAGIIGQWGPEGTMAHRWGKVPEARRPAVVGTALLRACSDGEKWRSSFFAPVLERAIEQELAPDPTAQAKAKTKNSPVGWVSAEEEERRESDRRAKARARQTERDLEKYEAEKDEEDGRLEKARQYAANLSEDELGALKAKVRARLKAIGPAAKVTGMEKSVWLEEVEKQMDGDSPPISIHR